DTLELVLVEGPVLRIEVSDSQGRPVRPFAVELEGPGGARRTELGGDGGARVSELTEGAWTITIHAFGHDAQHRTIAYPADARAVQRFELERAPLARGRVLDPEGRPRAGAIVFVDAPPPPSDEHCAIGTDGFDWSPSPREVETDRE